MCFPSAPFCSFFFQLRCPSRDSEQGRALLTSTCGSEWSLVSEKWIFGSEIQVLAVSSMRSSGNLNIVVHSVNNSLDLAGNYQLYSWIWNATNALPNQVSACLAYGTGCTTFQRRTKIRRHRCPCTYYSNSTAGFHVLLKGDLVFKLNPGPVTNSIPAIVSRRSDHKSLSRMSTSSDNARNSNNVIKVQRQADCSFHRHISFCVQFCLLNARSIKNKVMIVKDYVVDNDIDIMALTETWLRPGNTDDVEVGTLCPTGYRFLHVPRSYSRRGGVGVLFKDSLDINTSLCDTFQTFEFMDVRLRSLQCVRILVIYRPPDNNSCSLFFEEFSRLLEQVVAETPGCLLITGDFNFHMDDPDNAHTNRFTDTLESYDLKQHVSGGTHASGVIAHVHICYALLIKNF